MILVRLFIFIYVKLCVKLLIYVYVCFGCCFYGMNDIFFKKVVFGFLIFIIGLFNIFFILLYDCVKMEMY